MFSLVVYVPTFRRPESLSLQLEELRRQAAELPDRVRIIISDNSSEDPKVERILDNYEHVSNFTIIRRPFNILANANILQGFLHASKRDFLWILADDTTVQPGALFEITRIIDEQCPNLIGVYVEEQNQFPEKVSWSADFVTKTFTDFQWGLISSAVYQMQYFGNFVNNAFLFHNSSFPHLGVLLSAFKSNQEMSVAWIPESLVHKGNNHSFKTDYSLALCGFPHLFLFFDWSERKRLITGWVYRYGTAFLYVKNNHEISSKLTLSVIRDAGIVARILLAMSRLELNFRKSGMGRFLETKINDNPSLLRLLKKFGRLPFRINTSKESPSTGEES